MTTPTETPVTPVEATARPGSRADRMSMPLARDVLVGVAEKFGVCTRPLAMRRIDQETGQSEIFEVPCGARLASKCKPCAHRYRRERIIQFREGWHLTEEPSHPVEAPSTEVRAVVVDRCELAYERAALDRERMDPAERVARAAELDATIDRTDEWLMTHRTRGRLPHPGDPKTRTVRSTRRRTDAGALPRLPVDNRTVGPVYTGRDGRRHQPSTLLTITLPSYGPVHNSVRSRKGRLRPCSCGQSHGEQDPLLGVPIDPDSYDYDRAARDAVFFTAGLDRLWQNIRRAAGWKVQYAGCIELQRRLAPHAHYVMRGTVPREVLRRVAGATYHQVWWPPFGPEDRVYSLDRLPRWDEATGGYVDPDTGQPLPTWDEAMARLEAPDAKPGYVVRFGRIDARGIAAGSKDAKRSVRYVTKYLAKEITETASIHSDPQRANAERMHAALSIVPCSPTCPNWLLYGVQPKRAVQGQIPGRCSGKVHQRRTLGITGRRVLISREWSGKTLADHRADRRAWVRAVLAGTVADDQADTLDRGRFSYELARPSDPDVPDIQVRIMHAIATRQRWKAALRAARGHPPGMPGGVPATQDPVTVPQAA